MLIDFLLRVFFCMIAICVNAIPAFRRICLIAFFLFRPCVSLLQTGDFVQQYTLFFYQYIAPDVAKKDKISRLLCKAEIPSTHPA